MSFIEWAKKEQKSFLGELFFHHPMAQQTHYKIGGKVDLLSRPKSESDLHWLAALINKYPNTPLLILGRGSNVLIADQGFPALVIQTKGLKAEIRELIPEKLIQTTASVPISMLLRQAVEKAWGGLEFLAGIPGSTGGAAKMNAGTHLGESSGAIQAIRSFQFKSARWVEHQAHDLKYSYRKNYFLEPDEMIWSINWVVYPTNAQALKARIQELLKRRKETQPIHKPSCGSVFKNPINSDKKAWQIIDTLGLRGFQIGQASFAEEHSNWILNHGQAKAQDVYQLIELAKKRAKDELKIELQEEVILLGF